MIHNLLNLTWEELRAIALVYEKMIDDDVQGNLPEGTYDESGFYNEMRKRVLSKLDRDWDKLVEHYFKIHTYPKKGICWSDFKFNDKQKALAERINNEGEFRIVVSKGRQEGITSFLAAFAVAKALIKKRKILVYVPTGAMKQQFSDYITLFLRQYSERTSTFAYRDVNRDVRFPNGSTIKIARNLTEIRGMSADYIIADEIDFCSNPTDVDNELSLCLNDGGKFIATYTVEASPALKDLEKSE